ncbi:MAG: hypothetical protein H6715_05175 [Myxococcales bacterium]|nr:hypothetical protein [Myxococcales bacterium]MCB9709257.1 hypothetical protein [Myxococcales bacterium]
MPQIIRAATQHARLLKAEAWDAKERAKSILEQAQRDADRLRASAHTHALSAREDALNEARQAARAEMGHLLMEAQRIFDTALQTAETELVNLAVVAAERIVHGELQIAPNHINEIVREAVRRARDARRLRVFVHPDDKNTLERGEGNDHLDGKPYTLIEDPTLSRGSCIISTELGEIDARIETRLELIRRSMHR